jgi:hypothetical protein
VQICSLCPLPGRVHSKSASWQISMHLKTAESSRLLAFSHCQCASPLPLRGIQFVGEGHLELAAVLAAVQLPRHAVQ